jgi:hypothetical protein
MHRAEPMLPRLNALCERPSRRRLELFGSAAGNRATIRGLDFLVEFEALDPDGYADAYFGLLEDMEGCSADPLTWS